MLSARFWRTMLCAVLALCLLSVGTPTMQASSGDDIEVLIGFVKEIDPDVVSEFGGTITHEFTLIPVVAALIPASRMNSLSAHPDVEYVEENGIVTASQIIPWGVGRVRAHTVHSLYGTTGDGIKVAVLDTGIDPEHEDLYVHGGVDFTGSGYWWDDHGHGTHVAGTIAALYNDIDVVGVAPGVELYSVKVLNWMGVGSYDGVTRGIEWSIINGMQIVNMSLGGPNLCLTLERICNLAWLKYNTLLIAAAGNDGNVQGTGDSIGYPARFSSVMAVGATDSDDLRAYFSSTGPALEIMAPGVDIPSTIAGGGIWSWDGTSMASPHVAGVAALIWSVQPTWKNHQVRARLNATTDAIGNGNAWQYGNGLVNALKALTDYNLHAAVTTNRYVYRMGQTVHVTVRVKNGMNVPMGKVDVELVINTPSGNTYLFEKETNKDGVASFSFLPTLADGEGTYHVTASAHERGYTSGQAATTFQVYVMHWDD